MIFTYLTANFTSYGVVYTLDKDCFAYLSIVGKLIENQTEPWFGHLQGSEH